MAVKTPRRAEKDGIGGGRPGRAEDPEAVARLRRMDLSAFCDRWKVQELSLFGSVLRQDFRPESDIDFLATFSPEARWSLFDQVEMREELEELIGRQVDLVNRQAVERSPNPMRRNAILGEARPLYAQG